MLPVYNAITFQSIIQKGAKTKPWVVLVNANGEIKPYVVKFFDHQEIEARDCVANEVLGNILAKEFSLSAPNCALIAMDEDFRMSINNPEAAATFDLKDDRIKFGTELLSGVNTMDTMALTATQAKKIIDIGTLYGYDNLIRNRDRKADIRPNVLVKNGTAYLIDHEMAFDIKVDTKDELNPHKWDRHIHQSHLVLRYLKNSTMQSKIHYFDEFSEYLRLLNISRLQPYFKQLADHGYSNKRHGLIVDYLQYMKANYRKFEDLLKAFI
jgi:hypothetical protein